MPDVYDDLQDVVRAFCILSNARPAGIGGPSAIPFSDLAAYMRTYGVDAADDVDRFVRLVQFCDGVYLREMAKKAEAKRPAGKVAKNR